MTSRCCSIYLIVMAGFGIFAGLSAATVFFFHYGNIEASLWATVSAVFACCAMHLAVLLHKKTVVNWYSTRQLDNIQLLAFFLTTTSVAFFAWYIFYAAYYHIPMMPADKSVYLTSVWAGMTAKWTGTLILLCRRASKLLTNYSEMSDF